MAVVVLAAAMLHAKWNAVERGHQRALPEHAYRLVLSAQAHSTLAPIAALRESSIIVIAGIVLINLP